jgi:hypothetical protein
MLTSIYEKETKDFKCKEVTLGVKDRDVAAFNACLLSIEHM